MGTWNYRVIEFQSPDGEAFRSIHEVFYIDELPVSYAKDAASVFWLKDEGIAVAERILKRMEAALKLPILFASQFKT